LVVVFLKAFDVVIVLITIDLGVVVEVLKLYLFLTECFDFRYNYFTT